MIGRFPARAALALFGIFACQAGAVLLVALARRPGAGLACVALAMAIALRWARAYRRQAEVLVAAQIVSARVLLAGGRRTAAWNLACAAAQAAAGAKPRNAALALMAEVALGDRACDTAREVVSRMTPPIEPLLEAELAHAEGRTALAVTLLERARERRALGPAAARRLIELHAEGGALESALAVALEHLPLLAGPDLRNMIASLEAWGAPALAARLAGALAARRSDPHGGGAGGREVRLARAPDAGG